MTTTNGPCWDPTQTCDRDPNLDPYNTPNPVEALPSPGTHTLNPMTATPPPGNNVTGVAPPVTRADVTAAMDRVRSTEAAPLPAGPPRRSTRDLPVVPVPGLGWAEAYVGDFTVFEEPAPVLPAVEDTPIGRAWWQDEGRVVVLDGVEYRVERKTL